MKISFTYFPEFRGLEKYADTIELSGLPINENSLRLKDSWLFHFRRNSDGKPLHLLNPEQIKDSAEQFKKLDVKNPEIISLHLGFPAKEIGTAGEDDHGYAISKVYSKAETLNFFSESLGILSELSEKLNIPVAVENLDYHTGGAYEYVCEPEFIRSLLEKNPKIYFLLDVAHAEISAKNLHISSAEYISKLPLDKAIEIHLNSPDERFYDMHLPAKEREIDLIRRFKEKMPSLQIVNLEYHSKNSDSQKAIKETIPYLRKAFV